MIKEKLEPFICEKFLSDPGYRRSHIRIINAPPGEEIMGLHIPDMKRIAASMARDAGGRDLLSDFEKEFACGNALCHEEKTVWGFLLNKLEMSLADRLGHAAVFVGAIDNWAVCDSFCSSALWASRTRPDAERKAVWKFIENCFVSEHEFEVRFAVVMSMCHFLDAGWLGKIFSNIENMDYSAIESRYRSLEEHKECFEKDTGEMFGTAAGRSPYYVRMAVAWLLATSLAKFPDETRKFAGSGVLPEDVVRLYVRKSRESFRTRDVSPF